ncbi:MAG: hypothetical protein WC700_08855 [Gemmatimonadaceae bacterium]|jgi:hypothetical protein
MLALRFDRGRRGLRLAATSPRGAALLLVGYLAAWGVAGQRLTRSEAEAAVRTYLSFAMSRAQTAAYGATGAIPDSATAERWLAERHALDSAVIASIAVHHSLLDPPLSTIAEFRVRVRFASGVLPAERYFYVRKRPLSAPEVRRETSAWAWRLYL